MVPHRQQANGRGRRQKRVAGKGSGLNRGKDGRRARETASQEGTKGVVVCGAAGHLGSAITLALADAGFRILACDLAHLPFTPPADCKAIQADAVYLEEELLSQYSALIIATAPPSDLASVPLVEVYSHVCVPLILAMKAQSAGIQHTILLSMAMPPPTSWHALSQDAFSAAAAHVKGLAVDEIRLAQLPPTKSNRRQTLIRTQIQQAIHNKVVPLPSSLWDIRCEFILPEDAARYVVQRVAEGPTSKDYSVTYLHTPSEAVSYLQIAQKIADVTGAEISMVDGVSKVRPDVPSWTAVSDSLIKADTILSWVTDETKRLLTA